MDVRMYCATALTEAVKAAYPEAGIQENEILIEKPKNSSFGDLSCPIAMNLAKRFKLAPPVVAKAILDKFTADPAFIDPCTEKNIAGGFINFRISKLYLSQMLSTLYHRPSEFGRNQVMHPKKMLFEFVSANPTGPMVVVNARAAAIGDVVAKVNEWIGNEVEREFYVNDWGNQVRLLGVSLNCRYWQKRGTMLEIPEGGYGGEYVIDQAESIAAANPGIESMDESAAIELFKNTALEENIAAQQRVLESYGVNYTRWFRESKLHTSGKVTAVYEFLKGKNLTYELDGAIWFKAMSFGDDKDWVIFRSDGTPTYFLADIAYHIEKSSRGYHESFTFWGPDHHGYIPHLECSMKALDITNTIFKNFIIQQVNLIRDGQPFKMSKRKGDFITMSDLIDEVGKDAARYFFLMRRLSTHFDFDINLALKKSDDNPVFYVQYAHARTCNVIKHGLSRGFTEEQIAAGNVELLCAPEELDLMRMLADFPAMIAGAAQHVEPQRITTYIEQLAAQYHSFYQKHRIVTEDAALSAARMYLTSAARNCIKLTLDIIGVSAPENM